MRRLLFIAIPLVTLVAGGLFIAWDPTAPRFEPLDSSSIQAPAYPVWYGSIQARPIAGGKVWMAGHHGSNRPTFHLFDIEKRKLIGEVTGAIPLFADEAYTTALCMQRDTIRLTLRNKLEAMLERICFGHIRFKKPLSTDVETFWALDLKRGSARRLGERSTLKGASSAFLPSPRFRYAMSRGIDPTNSTTTFFCDLAARRWWTQITRDWPLGWWDDETLLQRSQAGDLELINIRTAVTRPLISSNSISSFLREHGIAASSSPPPFYSFWNGREFEFYLSEGQNLQGESSYFIRLRRRDGSLELVTKSFEFEPMGRFDESGNRYVYATHAVGDCCNGVSVRDLKAKTDRQIVPATDSSKMSYPTFYRDSVIYMRSNQLWRIDLNGSNHIRLFPPPDV